MSSSRDMEVIIADDLPHMYPDFGHKKSPKPPYLGGFEANFALFS